MRIDKEVEAVLAYEAYLGLPVDKETGMIEAKAWEEYSRKVCLGAVHLRQLATDRTDGIVAADFRDGSAVILCNTAQKVDRGAVFIIAGRKNTKL